MNLKKLVCFGLMILGSIGGSSHAQSICPPGQHAVVTTRPPCHGFGCDGQPSQQIVCENTAVTPGTPCPEGLQLSCTQTQCRPTSFGCEDQGPVTTCVCATPTPEQCHFPSFCP